MNNLLRTLVYNGQVSLTLADTTQTVKKAIELHRLSPASAYVFGKALSAMTYMSACLKETTGEISLSVRGDGECGDIGISGNRALHVRGYIENTQIQGSPDCSAEQRALGGNTAFTVIRDDGYNRPFVGACAIPQSAGVDGAFEEYYRISEQLPTRVCTLVEISKDGECVFAGVAALQPLPFADEETIRKTWEMDLNELLKEMKTSSVEAAANAYFDRDDSVWELREAKYECHCSREYLMKVLVTLGEEEFSRIVKEDGVLSVHCHYCNTDYVFTEEDAEKIF